MNAHSPIPTDTPFVAATKRNLALARVEMAKAYPNASPGLLADVTLAYAQLLASDEVSGRADRRAARIPSLTNLLDDAARASRAPLVAGRVGV